jgi:two-component system, cell cycle response regulator
MVNAMSEQNNSESEEFVTDKPISDPAQAENSNVQQTLETPCSDNSSYSALVVDDNPASQKLLALSISMQPRMGAIDFAENGESAINKAKTKVYDLIFLDAMMPGIDGYETCARLRKIPEYKNTPIIMVTGLDSPLDEAKGIIAGTTTYVTKPVQQVPFKRLLNRQLALLEYKRSLKPPDHQ